MANDERVLDCGHKPNPHSEHTTGTGRTPDGLELCWDCCNSNERRYMAQANHYHGYLTRDAAERPQISTWPGGELARVTEYRETKAGFGCGERVYFRATDSYGGKWYGSSPGFEMFARLHRTAEDRRLVVRRKALGSA